MYRIRFFMKIMVLAIGLVVVAGPGRGIVPCAQAQGPVWVAPETDAADRAYLHTVWTTDDGLPQNSVTAMVQTRDGYLWLATFGGLVRFDGITFTVFDVASAPGLAGNRLVALYEDRAGVLWIGHEAGEITRYENGVFRSYTPADGLPDGTVWAFAEDAEGTLWIGKKKGLVRFSDGVFAVFTTRDGLPDDSVYDLLIDRAGRFWLGTEGGLARYEDGRFTVFTMQDGLPALIVGEVFEDQKGQLWVGTSAGLAYYRDDRFIPLSTPGAPTGGNIIVEQDRHGTLWVGESHTPTDRRLIRMVPVAGGTSRMQHVVTYSFDALIHVIIEDREGNLWIGTDGDGLHRFREQPVRRYTTDDGLNHNSVFRVIGDGEGGVWFNAACENLTRYRDGTFTAYAALPDGGKIGCIWAMLRDRNHTLWLGGDGNLIRLDEEGYTRYTPEDGLLGENVLALFEDRDGYLWVGTEGTGVIRFEEGNVVPYTTADGLVHGDVRFITQDHGGAMWFGTRKGLSRLRDGVFTNFTAEDGLSPGMVRAIHEAADGTLWIGTYGGGLSRIKDGRITRYTIEDGLFDNVVSRILEDEHGNLWMLGNLGLFFVNRRVLNDFADGKRAMVESVSFGPDDGMAEGNGGGQSAGWQTDDGMMYFPTIGGLAAIDAKNFRRNDVPPPVVIERVLVNESEVDLRQPIEAPPGRRDVEIHYTGLSFTAPERVRFRYKLEGRDEEWHEAEDRRVAYFTNLAPGSYTFRVQAANNHGLWNETGAALSFSVKSFFYETAWFYALCVLVLGWLGYTVFRMRTRSIQARNIRLQAEIVERKQAEEAVKENEARLYALVESVHHYIWSVDTQYRLLTINSNLQQTYQEIFGLDLDVGDNILERTLLPEVTAFFKTLYDRALQGEQFSAELPSEQDGRLGYLEIFLNPIRSDDGTIRGVSAFAQDITERKRAEEALRASEEKFSKAFRSSADAVTISRLRDGMFLDVNEGFVRHTGYSRDDAVGKTAPELDIWMPKDRQRMVEVLQRDGHMHNSVFPFRMKSGELRDFMVSAEVIDLEGEPCLVAISHDITEQRRAEAEREELIAELEAKNAELERFTYTVSHDLKSPLVTIKGFLGLLQQDVAKGDAQRVERDIEQITSAADKMAQLLSELLELSRIGRLMNPPEAVGLSDLVSEAAAMVAGQLIARGVSVEIDPAMPAVHGDRVRLLEVFQNLIGNAAKFMGDQAEPRIEIGAQQHDDEVTCFVRDNGIGIDPKYHENVFGLFNRLNYHAEGTGIGLTLVRRIVEVHGGKIWIESEGLGQGTTFYFTLLPVTAAERGVF